MFVFVFLIVFLILMPIDFILAPIIVPYYIIKEKLEDNKKKKLAISEALKSTFRKLIYKEVR